MTGSQVSNNRTATDGGGIFSALGDLSLDGTSFTGNIADHDGGGLFLEGCCGGEVTIANSVVSGNTARHDGGGIYNNVYAVTLKTSVVIANKPNNCAGTPVAGCFG